MTLVPEQYYTTDSPELRPFGAPQTFARWRHEGRGPAYCKSGSRVVYRGADVLAWLESHRVETKEQVAA